MSMHMQRVFFRRVQFCSRWDHFAAASTFPWFYELLPPLWSTFEGLSSGILELHHVWTRLMRLPSVSVTSSDQEHCCDFISRLQYMHKSLARFLFNGGEGVLIPAKALKDRSNYIRVHFLRQILSLLTSPLKAFCLIFPWRQVAQSPSFPWNPKFFNQLRNWK